MKNLLLVLLFVFGFTQTVQAQRHRSSADPHEFQGVANSHAEFRP